jgi:hypothetical protein
MCKKKVWSEENEEDHASCSLEIYSEFRIKNLINLTNKLLWLAIIHNILQHIKTLPIFGSQSSIKTGQFNFRVF